MANVDLATVGYALVGGALPTFIWLWFWLKNDNNGKPEPAGLIALCFITGVAAVLFILPLEPIVRALQLSKEMTTVVYAITEELVKFSLVSFVAFRSRFLDEPIDYVTYLVTGALGFAALENTLYLIDPIQSQTVASVLVTGNLRFLGATVLHSLMAATIGVMIGLVFYKGAAAKATAATVGLLTASALHVLFNFFIMDMSPNNIVTTLGVLWVFGVFILLLVQKVKHLHPPRSYENQQYIPLV